MENKDEYIKRQLLEELLDDNKKKLKKIEQLEDLNNKEQSRSYRLKQQLHHLFGREYSRHVKHIDYCEKQSRKNLAKTKNTLLDEEAELKIKYQKLEKYNISKEYLQEKSDKLLDTVLTDWKNYSGSSYSKDNMGRLTIEKDEFLR